jgi:hypothetical protein
MNVPANPKLYHIVHYDKLSSIIGEGYLYSDAELATRAVIAGTTIGMGSIKARRLRNALNCHSGLTVGQCVPFYFCPRSVMLYLIHRANHEDLVYRGGQEPIIHLKFDLNAVVNWANGNQRRWAFTLSNAGSNFFEDRNQMDQLSEINWAAVDATQWSASDIKEGKQAEFLVEQSVPWELVERIGVINTQVGANIGRLIAAAGHRPSISIEQGWYY